MISPGKLEIDAKRLELKCARFLADRLSYPWAWGAALLLTGFVYYLEERFGDLAQYSKNGGFLVIPLIREGVTLAIPLAALSLAVDRRFRLAYQAFSVVAIWMFTVSRFYHGVESGSVKLALYGSVPSFCLAGWLYLENVRKRPERKIYGAILYSLGFWILSGWIVWSLYAADYPSRLILYWRFKTQFIWIMILCMAFASEPSRGGSAMALCPVNGMRGELWPVGSELDDGPGSMKRRRLWWQGFLGVLIGYCAIVSRMFLDGYFASSIQSVYLKYSSRYILAILAIIGFLNILTGLARMFGYQVVDGTSFVWLSRTPAEYWRRGSVYHYDFVVRYIYMPLKRWLPRLSLLVLFFAFFVFLINKTGFLDLLLFAGDLLGFRSPKEYYNPATERYTYTIWILWFIVMVVSRRYWFVRDRRTTSAFWGWASIALTHLIMSSLYYFSHLIQIGIRAL